MKLIGLKLTCSPRHDYKRSIYYDNKHIERRSSLSHRGGIPHVLLERSHVNDNASFLCPEYDVKGVQLVV